MYSQTLSVIAFGFEGLAWRFIVIGFGGLWGSMGGLWRACFGQFRGFYRTVIRAGNLDNRGTVRLILVFQKQSTEAGSLESLE